MRAQPPLKGPGWVQALRGTMVVPEGATYMNPNGPDTLIDFFVVSEKLASRVQAVSVMRDTVAHPHRPVKLTLSLSGAAGKAVALRKRPRWPGKPVVGPAWPLPTAGLEGAVDVLRATVASDPQAAVDAATSVLLTGAEEQALALFPSDKPDELRGRADGPDEVVRTEQVCPAGHMHAVPQRVKAALAWADAAGQAAKATNREQWLEASGRLQRIRASMVRRGLDHATVAWARRVRRMPRQAVEAKAREASEDAAAQCAKLARPAAVGMEGVGPEVGRGRSGPCAPMDEAAGRAAAMPSGQARRPLWRQRRPAVRSSQVAEAVGSSFSGC